MPTVALPVQFDGELHVVLVRYEHWLPKLLQKGGVSLGMTVYMKRSEALAHPVLLAHELLHTLDFVRRRKTVFRQWYALAVLKDLAHYTWDYIRHGFRYRAMKEERWAYEQMYAVLERRHPDIQIMTWQHNV